MSRVLISQEKKSLFPPSISKADEPNIKLDNEYERNIIIIKKVKLTPSKYPRNNGKALKNPIK